MHMTRWIAALSLVATLAARAANTGTDPGSKHAWGENIGWAMAWSANHDVTVHFDGDSGWLSGHAWGENIGWIKMGADAGGPYANNTPNNWGVNMDGSGGLGGYAWGENIGWINFGHAHCDAAIDPATGAFAGHAWGENIGWLKFSGSAPDYGVRTLAFDAQAQGTPNWWLDYHGVTEGHDVGDGVEAWRKYVMDTDPNVWGDYLQITALSNAPAATDIFFWPASPRRYYTLIRRDDLMDGGWSNVAGEVFVQYGTGGEKTMQDTNTAERVFYRVEVTVEP